MDSVAASPGAEIVRDVGQDDNDLAKAFRLCRERGWKVFSVLGATGKREDHTIGNIYRALEEHVRVVTEAGDFLPVGCSAGILKFRTWKRAGVSVFAPDPRTKMSSKGLKWKLAGVEFRNAYAATLNRASSECVTVSSDRPAFVYVERCPLSRRASVSLGSNVGNRTAYLKRALAALSRLPRTRLLDASSIVETKPVGVPREFSSMMFLNQAAVFETELEPMEFSSAMHSIEDKLGRVRTVKNGPRTIDIDLIDYEGVRMRNDELVLPHPRARRRSFVTGPLSEIGIETTGG
jgi:2-amino-4-hydroxy-6-hydroxymethyldihydropteridine diphosphokinase